MTNDLLKRGWQHKNKVGEGFTNNYNITKLVYCEVLETAEQAITREKQLKNLVRRKKVDLINKHNPEWRDLYDDLLRQEGGSRD